MRYVALRKESVDRNLVVAGSLIMVGGVALRKESVDRNFIELLPWGAGGASLSARRAWIEMLYQLYDTYAKVVALRKESVDRNIGPLINNVQPRRVALRKESVDRNLIPLVKFVCFAGRSPQGERG